MKKLFTAIRQGNLDEVTRILDKNPDLISCLAKAPPKKDDGQSPLMVAIKSDNLEVAHLLLDRGADVNFQDAPTQPHNESAPIWYVAVGQCFMRAGHIVSDHTSRNAWQTALDQYNQFARGTYPDYYVEESKAGNRQLREMLKAVLDELLKHGVNIHEYELPETFLPITSILLRNLEDGRELFEGFPGLDPDSDVFKPHTITHRGREQVIQPSLTVADYRLQYENKWSELEPVLRAYYSKKL